MIKNKIKILLTTILALSAGNLTANCEKKCSITNRTTLTPRAHGVNLALEKTAGWSNLITRKDEDKFGGSLQAAFFMMGSTKEEAIARYFLFPNTGTIAENNKCKKKCNDNCASNVFPRNNTTDINATGFGNSTDLDLGLLVHNSTTSPDNATASRDTTLTLCPEHKAIGTLFMYHQEIPSVRKGLSFTVNVPVVHVENTLRPTTFGSDTAVFGANTEKANLASYLSGNYEVNKGEANAQETLKFARMTARVDGECIKPCRSLLSKTGIADIEFMLGYKFLHKARYRAEINLGVTIPTGNQNTAEDVFEAIIGNGRHVGFGAGIDADATLWENGHQNLKMLFAFNYRYLFQKNEDRTLGIKHLNFGQYYLLIDRTIQPNAQQLIPAANVTTQRVNVKPGSQFDGILALNYNYRGLALDLGYNLFFRERERVNLNSCSGCNKLTPFLEDTWAIVTRNANMAGTFSTPPSVSAPALQANNPDYILQNVNRCDLSTCSAETPSLTTHKLYGGVAYWVQGWEVPVLVGVGGHYEWAEHNLISNWGFNAKLGVSF